MKNIQVIDGASNCTYDIYACSEEDFQHIFSSPDQDIQFAADACDGLSDEQTQAIFDRLWSNRVDRKLVVGIHGTLFYGHSEKRAVYPTKKEAERVLAPPWDPSIPQPMAWR